MSGPQKTTLWRYGRRVLIGSVLALLAAGFFLPVVRNPAKRGVLGDNFYNANQVVNALRIYANDNDGRFPDSLDALVPKYCPSDAVLWSTVADGKAKVPWQYFPGHKIDEDPPVIVIQSSPNAKGEWVTGYNAGPARILYKSDTDFRK